MLDHFLLSVFNSSLFSKNETQEITSFFKKIVVSKNDFLLLSGKIANSYWFIETGFLRAYTTDINGCDISTNFYSKNDLVIDWPSFFMKQPTRENIQCLSDCLCWEINYTDFHYLFEKYENFREHGRTQMVKSYFELKTQSLSMIADSAKDRYLKLIEEKPHIIQNVSLKHIASYLGITDTSLSRIRKDLTL